MHAMTPRRAGFSRIVAAALFVAACSDGVSPPAPLERGGPGLPMFDVASTGDQSGGLNQSGTVIGARFAPNPHRGDAIIATFFWLGSSTIDSVTDFLTDANSTPVHNTYRLVESASAGGISMATYVALNVQNFPDPSDPPTNVGLAVRANLHTTVTDGGVLLSAWSGVQGISTRHSSASGSGSAPTVAAPGAITLGAGDIAYAVTMSNAVVGRNGSPQGFTNLAVQSDPYIADQADYLASASGGSADPRWTWNFTQQSTWLATVLALTMTAAPPPPPGSSGNLTASAATTGSSLDPDGYTVTVDQTASQPIASNGGSATFSGLATGSHSVALSGVAPNCTVSGGNTQMVTVPSGGTATVSFSATCTTTASGSGITPDTHIGTANQQNLNILIKGFDNGNPRHGDAIVATFFWVSATTTNIIDSVTDVTNDANFTRVGNTYHLVRFVHSGNLSLATYVATNVQNFPDTNATPRLAVRANLRETVSDGGLQLSAWSGVASDFTQAMGATSAGFGSGTTYVADPGAIDIGAGALAYGVSLVSRGGDLLDATPPPEFTLLNVLSDAFVVDEANYLVSASARSVDPQWRWQFSQPGTWLAMVLALNPATGSANQPPVAAFGSSCSALSCGFTSTSSDPDGSIASYSWTFGDGAISTVQNPSHAYAAAGTYTVTLTVTDNQSATNAISHSVTVAAANQAPVAAFSSSCTALTCGFTSTSSDPDGSIASYSWTFGDGGTSTLQNPSHGYAAAGSYTVTLTVTDNRGATNAVSHGVTVAAANQAPTANFTFSCSGLGCNFTSTSSDPDGTIASYSWTFGDGGTSTLQNPSHSYAAGGSYTATLRVTDNQGAASATTSKTVTVTPPNQAPTANFTFSCSGLGCNFTSTSSDPDGTIASYSWTFGDGGTSTLQNPSHSYAAGGSYTVTLRVTDNQGAASATTSKTVTVTPPNQAPTANFTFSCSGLGCNFTSTSSDPDGTIASYSWTFGDGGTSTLQNPSHSYAAGGSYTATLRVTDNQGAASATTSKTVTVTSPNQAPTANFTFSCSGLGCNFTSTSSDPDGTVASYSWTFGDGGTSTLQNPSHSYAAGGSYTATLRVTDNQGAASATTSKTVTVTAPNQAPVVNAGPDEHALTGLLYGTSFSFSDANNNGPWTYTINWGDGSTTTGTRTAQGTFSVGHTYVIILPRNFTITVTVRDAAGASASDSKVVSVTLL